MNEEREAKASIYTWRGRGLRCLCLFCGQQRLDAHDDARERHVWRQAFPDSCHLPERAAESFPALYQPGCDGADVGAGADEQQDDEQQRLEIEERALGDTALKDGISAPGGG